MRFLIVYAHPSPSSFVGALRRHVVEIVSRRGHEVDELDLYAEKFDPVMSRHTYDCYLDTAANREEVTPYVARLLAAEALVLIYPVWHDGLPAILKGFIDRVFLPGVVFEIDEKGAFYPRLQNIRRLAAVATYGASRNRTAHIGDLPRRFFMRNLGTLVAPDASLQYIADYGMDGATQAQRARFLTRVVRACNAW
jgi:putative NADPH-quinone reductase